MTIQELPGRRRERVQGVAKILKNRWDLDQYPVDSPLIDYWPKNCYDTEICVFSSIVIVIETKSGTPKLQTTISFDKKAPG